MKVVLGWLLFFALVLHVAAHVTIALGLRGTSSRRALAAFFVPPLAPVWGWRAGMRRPVYAWIASLAAYAVGVAVA